MCDNILLIEYVIEMKKKKLKKEMRKKMNDKQRLNISRQRKNYCVNDWTKPF